MVDLVVPELDEEGLVGDGPAWDVTVGMCRRILGVFGMFFLLVV